MAYTRQKGEDGPRVFIVHSKRKSGRKRSRKGALQRLIESGT